MSSTATPDTARRLALAAAVAGVDAAIVAAAAVLVPQDADWRLAAPGWAALVAGPFVAAQAVRRYVPVDLRRRWAPAVTVCGWISLALVFALSSVPALVTGPPALLLVVFLLLGPFCGAWLATREGGASTRSGTSR